MKIDPTKVTNFNRTDSELEQFMIFCVAVAGKKAEFGAQKTQDLCEYLGTENPLFVMRMMDEFQVNEALRAVKLSPYKKNTPLFLALSKMDLRTCSLEDLLKIDGIGHKTAKMFLLHSRPNQEHIVLDVHILRWLKQHGLRNIPTQSPSKTSSLYSKIEERARRKVKSMFPNISFAEFDLNTWVFMSGKLA
jgi:thermostable 8-oxoguanine DNA glycosylase